MNGTRKLFIIAACLLIAFALWTLAVCTVDVQPIGPRDSRVGLASLNRAFHAFTGVHLSLYLLTDWLSLLPVGCMLGFAVLGLCQWIRRKHILRVDFSIRMLGVFYLVVLALYLFFEECIVNYRPVLLGGALEASYPSSTTMLVLCVMPTAAMQLYTRIPNPVLRRWICIPITIFSVCMVLGRLLSGVHWLSDIIGGALLSAGLVLLYAALCGQKPGL